MRVYRHFLTLTDGVLLSIWFLTFFLYFPSIGNMLEKITWVFPYFLRRPLFSPARNNQQWAGGLCVNVPNEHWTHHQWMNGIHRNLTFSFYLMKFHLIFSLIENIEEIINLKYVLYSVQSQTRADKRRDIPSNSSICLLWRLKSRRYGNWMSKWNLITIPNEMSSKRIVHRI